MINPKTEGYNFDGFPKQRDKILDLDKVIRFLWHSFTLISLEQWDPILDPIFSDDTMTCTISDVDTADVLTTSLEQSDLI